MKKLGAWDGDDILMFAVLLFVAAVIGLCTWCVAAGLRADGRVDYCFVDDEVHDRAGVVYMLEGHRAWRPNVVIASSHDPAELAPRKAEFCP